MSTDRSSRAPRFWALKAVVSDKLSNHVIAKNLATPWNTVCTTVLDLGRRLLLADASRLDGCLRLASMSIAGPTVASTGG